jgi:hypothetical protein
MTWREIIARLYPEAAADWRLREEAEGWAWQMLTRTCPPRDMFAVFAI